MLLCPGMTRGLGYVAKSCVVVTSDQMLPCLAHPFLHRRLVLAVSRRLCYSRSFPDTLHAAALLFVVAYMIQILALWVGGVTSGLAGLLHHCTPDVR